MERAATAVEDYKKEVCALASQLKDAHQQYEDNRGNLLANFDNANLNANNLVDVMQRCIVLLVQAIKHAEAGRANTLDRVMDDHMPIPKRSNNWRRVPSNSMPRSAVRSFSVNVLT